MSIQSRTVTQHAILGLRVLFQSCLKVDLELVLYTCIGWMDTEKQLTSMFWPCSSWTAVFFFLLTLVGTFC